MAAEGRVSQGKEQIARKSRSLRMVSDSTALRARLHTHRIRLHVPLARAGRSPGKSPLQQRHQTGTPVAKDKQKQKGHGKEIVVLDGVPNRACKIGPD